jgi:D-aspartate ligase
MELRNTSLPVLVLPMDHHGSLGAIRSLGRLGIQVYGVHRTQRPVASFSKYCRRVFKLDLDAASPEQSVDNLSNFARNIGGRPLLIATDDRTALFAAQNASRLQESFAFPQNRFQVVWSLYNKKDMYLLAKRLSIPTAETAFPKSRMDVIEVCEKAQFPLMLKASDNIRVSRRTGRRMVIVKSKDELLRYYDAMADASSPDLMIQEYIPGKDDSVWMFNGYFDERSECMFGVTARKIHQTPIYTGMTSLGVCHPNPAIESATKTLAKALGYKGILDIGYRYDARDGLYKLLDANPRLGATFRLFVAENGLDVVRAQYLHFTDQPIPASSVYAGRKWIVEDEDLISCIQYWRDGALTLSDWLADYAGIQESAWFAADDVKPFLRMCSLFSVRPFRKIFREGRQLLKLPSERVVENADEKSKRAARGQRLL